MLPTGYVLSKFEFILFSNSLLLSLTIFSSSAIFLANSSLSKAVSSLVPIEAPISS